MIQKTERRKIWRVAPLLVILAAVAIITVIASAGAPLSVQAALPVKNVAAQSPGLAGLVPVIKLDRANAAPADTRPSYATILNETMEAQVIDLGQLGIHPSAVPIQLGKAGLPVILSPFSSFLPNGGAIGISNAYMVASPDVVSQSTNVAINTGMSSFTPGESVQYYVNGSLLTTAVANANGRVAISLSTGAGFGYFAFEAVGLTSGKRAGTVAQVFDAEPPVPGMAAFPHAINTSNATAGIVNLFTTRYRASTAVTFARNGALIGTFTSGANPNGGRINLGVTLANNGDTSASYTAYTTTVGSMSGASVEERSDAGVPQQGDSNLSRAFVDRNIVSSVTGETVALVGEGFQAGETVNLTGCTVGSSTADANGAVGTFLTLPPGVAFYNCVYTGATSGRIGRGTLEAAALVTNAPAGINQPSNLASGASSFLFLFDRLLPSQSGNVYIDGVLQVAASTNASGFGSVSLTAPTSVGTHEVAFIGASGEIAIAPLYITPALPTPTPSITGTPTQTPTPGGPTNTNTGTPTKTSTATQTPTPCVGPGFIYEEVEPNNSPATANNINDKRQTQVNGTINPNTDVDYFSFNANAGDRIWAYVTTGTGDSQMTLLASDGTTVLQFDDDGGSQGSFSSAIVGSYIPSTGIYYLKVNAYPAAAAFGYILHIDRTTIVALPESEPNDTAATADAHTTGTIMTGTIGTVGDVDYYTFSVTENDVIVVQTDGAPDAVTRNPTPAAQFDPAYDIYGPDGTTLLLSIDDGDTFGNSILSESSAFIYNVPSGTYFIKVRQGSMGPTTGTYHLHAHIVGTTPCGPTYTPTLTRTSTRTFTPGPSPTDTGTPTITSTATPTQCATSIFNTSGALDASDGTLSNRQARSGTLWTCSTVPSCVLNGTGAGAHFDSYTLTNSSASPICIVVSLSGVCGNSNVIYAAVYSTPFTPGAECTNFLGAQNTIGSPTPFQVNIPASTTYVVVVYEIDSTTGCASYTLDVSAFAPCGTDTPTVTGTPPTNTPTITLTPTRTSTLTPTVTPTFCSPTQPKNEGFESGTLGVFAADSSNPSSTWTPVTTDKHSGTFSAFVPDIGAIADVVLTNTTPIVIPGSATGALLTFWHRMASENTYDGGVIEFSTDSGATWFTPTIGVGGYNGLINAGFGNPLAGRPAWTGTIGSLGNFSQVKIDLMPYVGTTVVFRFRFGSDSSVAATGWWIDDVTVDLGGSCIPPYIYTEDMNIWGLNTIGSNIAPFYPQSLTISLGTTVRWTNRDASTHTATSDTAVWDSGNIAGHSAGGAMFSYSYTFNTAGTYPYHCAIHPSMTGTIIVTGSPLLSTNALIAHLTWSGRPAQPNEQNIMPMSIELRLVSGGPLYSSQIKNTDQNGNFVVDMTGLPAGTYKYRAAGRYYLASGGYPTTTVSYTGASPMTSSGELGSQGAGNMDSDNTVGLADFTLLKGTFGKLVGGPGYDARADYDGNENIGLGDFTLLKGNFGRLGPPAIRPVELGSNDKKPADVLPQPDTNKSNPGGSNK